MFKKFSWLKIKPSIIIIAILFLSLLSLTTKAANPPQVIITEIAAFEKTDYEWLEIYNRSQQSVDLTGWTFWEGITNSNPKGANHKLTVSQGDFTLAPQAYAIIAQNAAKFKTEHQFDGTIFDSSWSSLNESGEQIGLKDKDKNIVESFTYLPAGNASLERISLNLDDYSDHNWRERANGDSAGRANDGYLSDQPSAPPDPAVDDNNVKPPVDKPLTKEIVDDAEKPGDAPATPDKSSSSATAPPATTRLESICEIQANAGADIAADPGEEIVFDGSASVILADEDEEIIYTWNFDDGQQANGIKATHAYQTEGDYHPYLIVSACGQDDKSKIRVTVLNTEKNQVSNKPDFTESNQVSSKPGLITEAKQLPIGSKLTLQGIVIIEPGIFSKNYFYIIDESCAGLQIYSYYADFPELKVGHLIEVNGELSQIYQEKRLKIKNKDNIKFLSVQNPPWPMVKKIADLSLKSAGDFIQAQGEIVEIKGDEIFMQDDTGELKIVLKENAGIDKSFFSINTQIKAAGIIGLTSSGLRLLPRFSGDLQNIDSEPTGQILGQTANQADSNQEINFIADSGQKLVIPDNKSRSGQILKYLLSLTAVTGVIIIGLIIKRARSSVG